MKIIQDGNCYRSIRSNSKNSIREYSLFFNIENDNLIVFYNCHPIIVKLLHKIFINQVCINEDNYSHTIKITKKQKQYFTLFLVGVPIRTCIKEYVRHQKV